MLKRKVLQLCLQGFVLLLALYPLAAAADKFECVEQLSDRAGLVAKVEDSYKTISNIQSRFVEQSYLLGLDRRAISKGTVWFQKPGKMNWSYEEPEKQQFLTDGKTSWFYQPSLQQVTLSDFQQSFQSGLPISFLLGLGSISETFKIKEACKNKEGFVLKLSPAESDNNVEELYLFVRAKDYFPLAAKILDLSSNETTISFFAPLLNQKLDSNKFTFEIPKGVDVIDQRSGMGAIAPMILEKNMLKE